MSSNQKTSAPGGLQNKLKNMTDTGLLLTITIVVFFLMYIGAMIFLGAGFRRPQMFFKILNDNAGLIILSCGLSLVMITQSIDISVGGVTALVSMCCAVYLDFKVGNVFGLVQGFLIAYLDIQPFIVTLAGMFFARGMTTIVNVNPFNVANEAFVALKNARVVIPGLGYMTKAGKYVEAYVELGVVVAVIVVIVLFCVLKWTKLGRQFYAVGGNSQSALMLGINVKRTKFLAHLLCGLLAGIGGFVYFLHVGSGAVSNGSGAEMNAIASSIIGGTMLTGGVGNIIGTFFGVVSLNTIKNIVSSAGLQDAWWTGITIAVMLCLFLVIQSVVIARKKKR